MLAISDLISSSSACDTEDDIDVVAATVRVFAGTAVLGGQGGHFPTQFFEKKAKENKCDLKL